MKAKGANVDVSSIGNKIKRTEVFQMLRNQKRKEKRKQRKERQEERKKLGDDAPPMPKQKTIESMRERDETIVAPEDDEIVAEQAMDEFSNYFSGDSTPKIAITTCRKPTKRMFDFIADLLGAVPNSRFFERRNFDIKKIVEEGIAKGYTDLIVINEDQKKLNALLLIHLPGGPTAHFKLTSVRLNREIKGHGEMTSHQPEVILNNFNTRLGQRVGRMVASLFEQKPQFQGRRVVTLHNQRDFVFFRQHRYVFHDDGKATTLQELGPQFTLKLKSLQHGVFDPMHGEYEFKHKAELDTSRRRFFI